MNVFTYRPKLQYVYEEIDTIYNALNDKEKDYIQDYIPNIENNYIDSYEAAKETIYELKDLYTELTNNISISYPNSSIPGYVLSIIEKTNSDKYGNMLYSNTINGEFINEYKDASFISEIKYHWDSIMGSINGNGIVEINNVLEKIEYFLKYFDKCLDKTIFLWYNIYETENKYKEFNKNYLLKIEDLILQNNKREEALRNQNDEAYKISVENIHTDERILNCTKNYIEIISQVSRLLNVTIEQVTDMIDSDKNYEHLISVNNRVKELKEDNSLDDKTKKTLLFNSYKKNAKDLNRIEAKEANVYSQSNIKAIIDNFGRQNKYYVEVLNNSLSVLKDNTNNKHGYINCLLDGLTNIKEEYEQSSLIMSNFLSSFTKYLIDSTNLIYKKNDIRTIYQNYIK